MRRVVNLRIMLLAALCEILFLRLLCLYSDRFGIGLALIIAFYIGGIAMCGVSFKFSPRRWFPAIVVTLLAVILTHVSFVVQWKTYYEIEPDREAEYTVAGTVDSVIKKNNTLVSVCVSDIVCNGGKIRGKIQVVFREDDIFADRVQIGNRLTVRGKLYKIALLQNGEVDGEAYRRDLRYRIYGSFADCTVTAGNPNLFVRIRSALYARLRTACGDRYGAIAYCMLTGDKGELDTEVSRLYNESGIGHVLAVSGLHVGLLAAGLNFILKKLRLGNKARVGISSGVLILYALFVGMSASVVRAVIMCIIALLTMVNGQRKDALSALCFAFTVLLIAQPFLLFEVGFLLSFSAVFGLILFARTFTAALCRIRIPAAIANPLAATAAVHLGIVPVMVCFFGVLQTYSILFNLLLVPLLSATFAFFLATAPICVLFGWNLPLRLGASGFALGDLCMGITQYLPLNSLYVYAHKGLYLLYVAYFAASRYCMIPRYKRLSSCAIMGLCAVIVAAPTLATLQPSRELYHALIPVRGYGDVTTIVVDDEITVIGDGKSLASLRSALRQHSIRKIDTFVLHGLSASVGASLAEFVRSFSVGKIVCPSDTVSADGLAALGRYPDFYVWEEANMPKLLRITDRSGEHAGFGYRFSDKNFSLLLRYSANCTDLSPSVLDLFPVIRCYLYTDGYPDRVYLTDLPKGYAGKEPSAQFSVADLGGFAFSMDSGKVLQK